MFQKSRERRILSTEIAKSYSDSVSSRRSISQWSFLNFDICYTCIHAYARKYMHCVHACDIFHIPYFLDPAVVGSQEWQALYTKLLRFPENISHSYLRDKRFALRPMTSSSQVRKRITDVILQIQIIFKIKIIVIEIFF